MSNIKPSNIELKNSFRRILASYCINQGLHWFAVGIIFPVMILTLMDFGFDIGRVGIMMAVMGTTVLVLELPTGGIADTIGRKRVYIISVVIYISGYAIILLSQSFVRLLAAGVLIGSGRALSSGTMDAWFIDEHKRLGGDDQHLQQDLARAGVIITASLGAGTLLGGFIPDISGGFRMNIIILMLLYLVQSVLTVFLIKEERSSFSGSIADGFRRFPHVLGTAVKYGIKQRNVLAILIAAAALGIGLSSMEQLWQPRVREISSETGSWVLGVLAAGYFASAAAASGLSPLILKIFGQRYRLVLFLFRMLMALLYIVLSYAAGLVAFAPLYFMMFFAHGATESPEMTLFNRDIPSNKRSSLLSLKSLFMQAGGAAGSVAAGQIALRVNIPAAWKIAGLLLAVSAFSYLFIRENGSKEAQDADKI